VFSCSSFVVVIGDLHLRLQFSEVSELSLDNVLMSLGRIIASDSGEVHIAQMKADYQVSYIHRILIERPPHDTLFQYRFLILSWPQAMIDSAVGGAGGPAAKSDGGIVLTRKTAIDLGVAVKGPAALKAVQDPMGAFNWVSRSPEPRWMDRSLCTHHAMICSFCAGSVQGTGWLHGAYAGLSYEAVADAAYCTVLTT
jgi:hypothetical protein